MFGIEADGSWADIKGNFAATGCNSGNCFTTIEAFGTARARVGFAHNTILWYGTGGAAFGRVNAGIFTANDVTQNRWGWTAGAGVETGWGPWSAKAEYLYMDLGNDITYTTVGSLIPTRVDVTAHLLRLGVNYRFGAGSRLRLLSA